MTFMIDVALNTVARDDLLEAWEGASTPVSVYSGPDFRLVYANPAYLRVTGRRLGEKQIAALCPTSVAAMNEVRQTGKSRILEEVAHPDARSDGPVWDLELRPMRPGPDGEARVLKIAHDVTERVRASQLLEAIMTYVPIGLTVALGPEARIVRVADHGARILGRPRSALENVDRADLGKAYTVLVGPDGPAVAPDALPLVRAARTGEVVTDEVLYVEDASGTLIPMLCNSGPIRDAEGNTVGAIVAWHDMRPQMRMEEKLRAALDEKDTLLKELAHRVKNALQRISSLLSLQAARAKSEEARASLLTANERVMALAQVHREIYAREEIDGQVDVSEALGRLVAAVTGAVGQRLAIRLDAEPIDVPLDQASPFILMANELIYNAVKHAFPDGRRGTIEISLRRRDDGQVEFRVADDGVGLSPGSAPGFGSMIAEGLARQVHGKLNVAGGNGTVATFVFEPSWTASASPAPDRAERTPRPVPSA
jgi:two-component sensor histidine kinase